ncbi:MAG: HlyD family secretion protein [Syntrophaceae bacterium]
MNPNVPAPENVRQRGVIIGVFFLIVALVGVGVYGYVRHTHFYISTDDAYVSGRVYTIASKVPGTVMTLPVQDNQLVKQGDLLLEIDARDYDVRVRDAQAMLATEESKLNEAKARIALAGKQLKEIHYRIASAQAGLKLQEANLIQASQDLARAKRLFQNSIIPRDRLEKAQTAYDVASSQRDAAREQLKQAQAALEVQTAAVEQTQAAFESQHAVIAQRRASLSAEQLKQSYTRIYAPADGFITKRSVEVGNQVQAGQPLMAVVSLNDVWIVANYKETQLSKVRPGQKVSIVVDTFPGRKFSGRVQSIMAGTGAAFALFPPENATGNYVKVVQRIPVKIILDKGTDPDHVLRLGMSVIPTIAVRDR